MPSLTTWAAFCPCGQWYPRDQNKHTAAPVKVARQQTTREPSGTFATLPHQQAGTFPQSCLRNLHQHIRLRNLPRPSAPTHASIHRNPPKSSGAFRNWPPEPDLHHFTPELSGTFRNLSRTYTSIRRNSPEPSGTCLRNLHQHTPELSGTFRNPSPEPTPAYAGTFRNLPELASRRNSPEPSGTRLRNLHQHTPELSGTFRNPPAEPTAAHHRTLWNLPEPSSGTCSCDPHRHTPELIWAEDPISLRCWGKKKIHLKSKWEKCCEKPRTLPYLPNSSVAMFPWHWASTHNLFGRSSDISFHPGTDLQHLLVHPQVKHLTGKTWGLDGRPLLICACLQATHTDRATPQSAVAKIAVSQKHSDRILIRHCDFYTPLQSNKMACHSSHNVWNRKTNKMNGTNNIQPICLQASNRNMRTLSSLMERTSRC